MSDIVQYFEALPFDDSWTFAGCTPKDTNYVTHGYHRYPAKFIPQLAARLIRELSAPGDLVVDPFMGSATTLVEAKILGRPSVGVDINPVAHLIAQAKVTPLEPRALEAAWTRLAARLDALNAADLAPPRHARLDYWFPPQTQQALARIHAAIRELPEPQLQNFFLCGFSHILKNCSVWLMKSVKPTRDRGKTIPEPRLVFAKHVRQMLKRNADFWDLLQANGTRACSALPYRGDSRQVPARDDSATLVVTSPPYVTSYEYADLHQLSALWLGYADDLGEFRKPFIGSAQNDMRSNVIARNRRSASADGDEAIPNLGGDCFAHIAAQKLGGDCRAGGSPATGRLPAQHAVSTFLQSRMPAWDSHNDIGSELGARVVDELERNRTGKSQEVAVYFSEMRESFVEMRRYLKRGGKACIVIGDTAFKRVAVPNAEVFVEQMLSIGFKIHQVIKRRIPSKILPQTRDPRTGKFTSSSNRDKTLAYPHEYIIIMEKV